VSAMSPVRVEAIITWSVCEVFACAVEVATENAYMQRGWRVEFRPGDGTSGHSSTSGTLMSSASGRICHCLEHSFARTPS
jgi:hypothetical protein